MTFERYAGQSLLTVLRGTRTFDPERVCAPMAIANKPVLGVEPPPLPWYVINDRQVCFVSTLSAEKAKPDACGTARVGMTSPTAAL